ncbi:MAG: glycosyltransferase [Sphingobacteriales bacterium]|nr:glycosyltransferase [Sphingobacteriales bacterium]
MTEHIIILIPVYNDGESANRLLAELADAFKKLPGRQFSVLLLDDGSGEEPVIRPVPGLPVKLLHLLRNIGHQKAIAIGLAYIKENLPCDKVLVMDSDGEDRPEDAVLLVNTSTQHPGKIIFARRKSRSENKRFRLFYTVYKWVFRILTGHRINFGNFLILPAPLLNKLVYYSEIWSHIAGGIIKTGLPYLPADTHRGKRYAGHSKMSFTSLLLHGLGAIAVFIEVIASRLLLFSLVLIGFSLLIIFVLLGIKTLTSRAIPGWTSTVTSAMLIILLQSFLLSLFTIFLYLSAQSQRKFIPAKHYTDYTGKTEIIG